ncbi:MAG: HPr-rel-A system PqqD family peptide chaperone [Gammaproteobacteria bacterium]
MRDILHSRWRIEDGGEILSQRFGNQFAIYHRGSGDTHLLDEVSFLLLDEINSSPCGFAQLLKKLSAEFEFESQEQSQEYLNSLLAEFEKLSIVERLDT